jgi:hypothetical protein
VTRSFAAALLLALFATAHAAAAAPPAASRATTAAREAKAWREKHEWPILEEFAAFLALPNVASDHA